MHEANCKDVISEPVDSCLYISDTVNIYTRFGCWQNSSWYQLFLHKVDMRAYSFTYIV